MESDVQFGTPLHFPTATAAGPTHNRPDDVRSFPPLGLASWQPTSVQWLTNFHSLYQLVIIWIRNVKVLNQLTEGYLLFDTRAAPEKENFRNDQFI